MEFRIIKFITWSVTTLRNNSLHNTRFCIICPNYPNVQIIFINCFLTLSLIDAYNPESIVSPIHAFMTVILNYHIHANFSVSIHYPLIPYIPFSNANSDKYWREKCSRKLINTDIQHFSKISNEFRHMFLIKIWWNRCPIGTRVTQINTCICPWYFHVQS